MWSSKGDDAESSEGILATPQASDSSSSATDHFLVINVDSTTGERSSILRKIFSELVPSSLTLYGQDGFSAGCKMPL